MMLVSVLAFCGFDPNQHLGQCLKYIENWRLALLWPITDLVIAFSHLYSGVVMLVVLGGVVYWLRKTIRARKA